MPERFELRRLDEIPESFFDAVSAPAVAGGTLLLAGGVLLIVLAPALAPVLGTGALALGKITWSGLVLLLGGAAFTGWSLFIPIERLGQKISRGWSWSSFKLDMKKCNTAYCNQFDAIKGAWEYQMQNEKVLSDLREKAMDLQKSYREKTSDSKAMQKLREKLKGLKAQISKKLGGALQLPNNSRCPMSELNAIERMLAEHFWATRYLEGKLCDKMMRVYNSWKNGKGFPTLDPTIKDPYGNTICKISPQYDEKNIACLLSGEKPAPPMAIDLLNRSDGYKKALKNKYKKRNGNLDAVVNYFRNICNQFDNGSENLTATVPLHSIVNAEYLQAPSQPPRTSQQQPGKPHYYYGYK